MERIRIENNVCNKIFEFFKYPCMESNIHLQFLRDKINEIGSALFFSESNDILKMPVSIVTTLKVDDEGQIWFYINSPFKCVDILKNEFPVHLDFFRKGKLYFLKVAGKAAVSKNDLNEYSKPGLLLIKVKMMSAEYFEKKQRIQKNILRSFFNSLYNWLHAIDPSHIPYTLTDKGMGMA